MAKTLLELFRTNPLPTKDGKTAKEAYDIRNSKDIGIQTNSTILNNSSVYAVNLIRRNLGFRKREMGIEQELTGIRPLYAISSPFIYGTDIIRMTTKTNPQTETMKNSANGGGGVEGPITQQLNSAKGKLRDAATKLGVEFPSDLNPTSYYEKLEPIKNVQGDYPKTLKSINEGAAGNIAGQLLSQGQTPSQLVRSGAGAALSFVKKKAQGVLIGERSTTGFAVGGDRISKFQTINYGSNNDINLQAELNDVIDAGGTSYSKTIERTEPIEVSNPTSPLKTSLNFTDGEDEGEFSLANKTSAVMLGTWELDSDGSKKRSEQSDDNNYSKINGPNGEIFNPTFTDTLPSQQRVENSFGTPDNEYSLYTKSKNAEKIAKIQDFDKKKDFSKNITRFTKIKANEKTLTKRGFGEGTRTENGTVISSDPYRDVINLSTVFPSDENNTILGDSVDDLNFIPLKFTLLYSKQTIHFRSSINGVSETFSPTWDSAKFIGNPFSYYTYSGIDRSVTFNLEIMANSPNELKSNWERLSFLASLTHPAAYESSTSYIIPPFIKFTLGDMYKGKEGFIESLSYTFDDNAGWEIGLNKGMENYKLPKKIDVSITIKFLLSRNNTQDYKKFYSFKPVS